ncbi:Synembryn-A [Blattella germanica]|nr:Synembryn-A [Blattella germanica]
MEEEDLIALDTGSTDDAVQSLQKFIEKNLKCIIFSRDKTGLDDLVCEKWLETLLRHAGLVSQEEALSRINDAPLDYEVMLEALKCLCNIIYNSPHAQTLSARNHSIEGIVMRLRTYRDPELPQEIKLFDMKMLFLITALRADVRPTLRSEMHGLTYLMETLDLILKEASGHDDGATCSNIPISLSDDQVALACEVLKVLFNLTCKSSGHDGVDEEEEAHFLRLVSILHDLLVCEAQSCEKQDELQNHTVNLLMSVPSSCYEELATLLPPPPRDCEFEGRNMEAVVVLVDFLDRKLTIAERNPRSQHEVLCPILSVLLECARHHRSLRKFLRARVLPPLTDIHTRPEEGTTVRNKLCRLLTSPSTQLNDLTADFLFILCKENVARMVKYTGYGNAAGLLAKRGLMLGGSAKSSCSSGAHYSSDSEDSDTEIYKKHKSQIDVVTGHFRPPHPDPTASMTEEQKEYEAMELVNMIDRLTKDGIVQPCRIGEDGRPEPLEDVHKLLEDLPRQQMNPNRDN